MNAQISCKRFYLPSKRIQQFADIIDDHNPIHLDQGYAATTQWKTPIVHGAMLVGCISSLLSELNEGKVIIKSLDIKFIKAVPVNVAIWVVIDVKYLDINLYTVHVVDDENIVYAKCDCELKFYK